ncbi:DUF4233 domain-containing protein [Ornithinimicrobium avium]|uniref:DUF4233 domain-containing protein n=1 Tax=Ornithinimicrobium avium TaxID=2283195 RepID=A0A345NLI4_9MICO|nr:DUF4233 domain-containing protein [Ornithinimicrobium avium]AXH95892.1 DUF4233 domain-containing protein [Ornithinimicrobium avium]
MTSSTHPDVLRPPARPGPTTRRLCGAALVAQALSVFLGSLVAWRLASTLDSGSGTTLLLAGVGLAVLCLVTVGALRTSAGIWLGWLCQVLTLASAFLLPAMLVVGLIFAVLWWVCLSNGLRIDADKARFAAEAG